MIRIPILTMMVLLSLAITAGCATSKYPAERTLLRGKSTVASGVEAGLDAVETQESVHMKARYNPCRCPAPDFETYLRGSWQRVIIGGDEEIIEALRESAESQAATLQITYLRLSGKFDGSSIYEESGIEYELFTVKEFNAVKE